MKNKKISDTVLMFFVIIFIQIITTVSMTKGTSSSDYPFHLNHANNLNFEDGVISFLLNYSYPLWHLLVKFFNVTISPVIELISGLPQNIISASIVNSILTAIAILYTYKLICYIVGVNCNDLDADREMERGRISEYIPLLVVIIFLVSAIYIRLFNKYIYLGQGSINIYHNPTFIAVKPFAIASFYYFIFLVNNMKENIYDRKLFIKFAVFLFLSVLAKPSFLQVFIFLLLLISIYLLLNKKVKYVVYISLCIIPSLLFLMFQFIMNFNISGINHDAHEIYIKFVLEHPFTDSMFISLLLFLAFPLYVIMTNLKEIKNNIYSNTIISTLLSLFLVIIGYFQVLLLHERGREKHGNFFWGYMGVATLLWITTLSLFVKDINKSNVLTLKHIVGLILLSLHTLSGILYIMYVVLYGKF